MKTAYRRTSDGEVKVEWQDIKAGDVLRIVDRHGDDEIVTALKDAVYVEHGGFWTFQGQPKPKPKPLKGPRAYRRPKKS